MYPQWWPCWKQPGQLEHQHGANQPSHSPGCEWACALLSQPDSVEKKKSVEDQATVRWQVTFGEKKPYNCSPTSISGNLAQVICGREGIEQSLLGDSGISPFQNCAGFPIFFMVLKWKQEVLKWKGVELCWNIYFWLREIEFSDQT